MILLTCSYISSCILLILSLCKHYVFDWLFPDAVTAYTYLDTLDIIPLTRSKVRYELATFWSITFLFMQFDETEKQNCFHKRLVFILFITFCLIDFTNFSIVYLIWKKKTTNNNKHYWLDSIYNSHCILIVFFSRLSFLLYYLLLYLFFSSNTQSWGGMTWQMHIQLVIPLHREKAEKKNDWYE